ncbi:MAG: 30S ribosome-binding factor RbfA [Rikenellaceae bacterium]|nr:30S ribosome-binding factor RbfA [Rikenellaceae bacterium]
METTRQQKVARQIQKDISDIFTKEASSFIAGSMVSVTKVRVSPDLSSAKIYLSVFPFDKSERVLENVKANSAVIRKALGSRVKLQFRIVPELMFYIDDSLEYISHIDELLN